MAEFGGDLSPCGAVGLAFLLRHRGPVLAACQRAGLTGQDLVAVLGIGVTVSVRIAQVHLEGLVFEPLEVFDITKLGRDQGAATGHEFHDVLEDIALFQRGNRDGASPAPFGPTGLQRNVVATYRSLRLEFHRLLAAQAKGRLQQE